MSAPALITAQEFNWYDYQDLKAKLDNQMYQVESTHRHKLKKQSKLTNFETPVYYQSLWINPETFKILDGKLYLFYNAYFNNTLKSWNKNETNLKKKADAYWKKISGQ